MAEVSAALIAVSGLLVTSYITNFWAEDFRRFRERQAIAAALAGELRSILSALPEVKKRLIEMREALEARLPLNFPEFPQPSSPIFEANTVKVGLLGPALGGDVAYVYDQITAFRASFHMISKHHEKMPWTWSASILKRCLELIESNELTGERLKEKLIECADESYVNRHSFRGWWVGFVVILFVICIAGGAYCLGAASCQAGSIDGGQVHSRAPIPK